MRTLRTFQIKGTVQRHLAHKTTTSQFTITVSGEDIEDAIRNLKFMYNDTCFDITSIGVI